MELKTHEPRMVGQLDDFDEILCGIDVCNRDSAVSEMRRKPRGIPPSMVPLHVYWKITAFLESMSIPNK